MGLALLLLQRQTAIEIQPTAPSPVAPSQSTSTASSATSTTPVNPTLSVTLRDKGKLRFQWENLPAETKFISIFRSPIQKNRWLMWQSFPSGGLKGNTEVIIGPKENLNSYSYYFQALSGSGNSLYTSSSTLPQSPTPGGQSAPPAPPIGGFNLTMGPASGSAPPPPPNTQFNQGSTATSSPASTTNQFNQSNLTTSTGPQPTSTAQSQTTVNLSNLPTSSVTIFMKGIYYSPQGIPIGSGVQDADFWAIHIDQSTEVGWQNLPVNTDAIIIYRSTAANGPWIKVLEQTRVSTSTPAFIRLIDNSTNSSFYYEMEARAGGTILTTYGPVLLSAL